MQKTIALVAHDHKKADLIDWVGNHIDQLRQHKLVATGTTGSRISQELGLDILKLQSGPLGGDQQIGAMIAEKRLDCLVFFWDPLNPAPHDPDVKALLRLCSVWNLPVACTTSTADMLITSPLFNSEEYVRYIPDY